MWVPTHVNFRVKLCPRGHPKYPNKCLSDYYTIIYLFPPAKHNPSPISQLNHA